MIDKIREYFFTGFIAMVAILILSILIYGGIYQIFFTETVTVEGTIIYHGVTNNRSNDRTYITIIKTDDGEIREETGLSWFSYPINQRVKVNVRREIK